MHHPIWSRRTRVDRGCAAIAAHSPERLHIQEQTDDQHGCEKAAHRIHVRFYSDPFGCDSDRAYFPQSLVARNRSAFDITETELKLIAAAAIIGLRSRPNTGKS